LRVDRATALACLALVAADGAHTQPPLDDDVPPPPRIDIEVDLGREPPPVPRGSAERPNAARLAPLPEGAEDLEEIVVVADPALRLPDLGTTTRLEREAREAREARIQVTYLPPPEPIDPRYDPLLLRVDPEARRVGYLELFRLRFGRRRD